MKRSSGLIGATVRGCPIRRLDPNCSRTSPSLNARNVTGLNTTVHVVHAVRRRFVRRSRRDRYARYGGSRAGKCRTVNGDGGRIDSARLPRTVVRKSPRVPWNTRFPNLRTRPSRRSSGPSRSASGSGSPRPADNPHANAVSPTGARACPRGSMRGGRRAGTDSGNVGNRKCRRLRREAPGPYPEFPLPRRGTGAAATAIAAATASTAAVPKDRS